MKPYVHLSHIQVGFCIWPMSKQMQIMLKRQLDVRNAPHLKVLNVMIKYEHFSTLKLNGISIIDIINLYIGIVLLCL